MKKKSAAKVIEDCDLALIKVIGACHTFMQSPTCPEHIKPWFQMIMDTAKKGIEHE